MLSKSQNEAYKFSSPTAIICSLTYDIEMLLLKGNPTMKESRKIREADL